MASKTTDPRRPVFPTFVWGFILFCFFGLLAVVAVRYYGNFQSYDAKRGEERLAKLAEYRKSVDSKLGTLAWADKEKQTVQVPIAVAMEIAAKNLNRKKVAPSAVSVAPPAAPAEPTPEAKTEPATPQPTTTQE